MFTMFKKVKEIISSIYTKNKKDYKWLDYLNVNNYLNYFISHKEKVLVVSTILGVAVQFFIIFFWFWLEGLPFISFKFSLVLISIFLFWIILWWLFSLVLLIWAILLAILWAIKIWYFRVLVVIALVILTLLDKQYKFWLEKKINVFEKKYNKFMIANTLLLIISTILLTILWLNWEKSVKIFSEKKIMIWKMVLYNQDNYFIESCWKKIIIPAKNVDKIEFLCPWYNCKNNDLNKIYQQYCKNMPFNF